MLGTAIVLFAIAAVGGAVLAGLRIANRPLPLWLAIVHGILAATGLVILIVAVVNNMAATTIATASLIVFLIAAVGGGVLFSLHLSGKSLPIPLVLGHGLAAVIAFILLLMHAIG